MFNDHMFNGHFLKACLAAVFALALTACSSSSDSVTMTPDPDPTPTATAYETAKAAIAAAETAEAVDAALAAAEAAGDISAAQLRSLEMAVADRKTELAKAAADARRAMLVAAAACEAATAECVAAHDALIAALQADVDRLADDDDATNAQQNAAQEALEEAQEARDMVQMDMDELDRTTTAGRKVGEAMDAANGLEDDRSAEAIAAAKVAIEEAEEAVGDDDSYDERIAMAQRYVDRAEERNTVDAAVMKATNAANGLTEASDAAAVTAAQEAIAAAKMAVADAEHLTDVEKTALNATITSDERLVTLAKNRNDAAAEEKRLADEKDAADKDKADAATMAATAAKLYAGIDTNKVPVGDFQAASPPLLALNAGYNNVDVPDSGVAVDTRILVSIGAGDTANTAAPPQAAQGQHVLSEDKKTTVAANHGWEGKRYADPAGGNSVEAMVWSNVGDPTEGDPFNEEYTLNAANVAMPGELTEAEADGTGGDDNFVAARVASPSFDQSAGIKEFKKGDNLERVVISGSYHGVSGSYYCTPAADSTCAAQKAAEGFTLGGTLDTTNAFTADGGTWTFKPGTATAKVMSVADTAYASYGWWLWTAENGEKVVAHMFTDEKGEVPAASGINALNGTATYQGGAAGKYALISAPGGANDAGHFTARATLEADFTNNTAETAISGTIDQFIGADGESRDWEVELSAGQISDVGLIGEAAGGTGEKTTVWTIGETAAAAAGEWNGKLLNNGDDGVPQVATGTFAAEYSTSGRMVGAFGANKQ